MVPAAVEPLLRLVVEVDEVDQQLLALGADEAGGVPAPVRPGPLGKQPHLSDLQRAIALITSLAV